MQGNILYPIRNLFGDHFLQGIRGNEKELQPAKSYKPVFLFLILFFSSKTHGINSTEWNPWKIYLASLSQFHSQMDLFWKVKFIYSIQNYLKVKKNAIFFQHVRDFSNAFFFFLSSNYSKAALFGNFKLGISGT